MQTCYRFGAGDECLNQHRFLSLDEAQAVTQAWMEDYDRVRPHGAPGNRTPSEFARPVTGHVQLPALHGEHLGWYQDGSSVNQTDHPLVLHKVLLNDGA